MNKQQLCLLCKRTNTKPYLSIEKFSMVKCQCGLFYTYPQPTQEELSVLYSGDYAPYIQKVATTLTPEESWLASHSALHYRILRKIKRLFTRPKEIVQTVDTITRKTVLDFGYGNGRYLLRMKREHPLWSLYGYDIDDKPLSGITTTSNLDKFNDIFDIINISHVLEHLTDPKETLLQLKSLLKEGGEIVIEVPNIDCWKFRVFGKHYGNLCLPYHLFHFSPKTITELSDQCGLSVRSLKLFGSAKCTIRSIYNLFNIKRSVGPYQSLIGGFFSKIIGEKRIDTDILKAVLEVKQITSTVTNNNPLVSIIMPAYNAEKYIAEAIESVLSQTYSNWELIIADDFSTDSTAKIVDSYKKKDERVKSIRMGKNSGPVIARNKAIEKSSGEYLAMLDADDVSLPDRLAKQVGFLEYNKDIDFVGSSAELIDENGKVVGKKTKPLTYEEIKFPILLQTQFIMSSVVLKKKAFIETCGFDNAYLYAEDYDMWTKLLALGKKCANIKVALIRYRIQPQSLTQMSLTQPIQERNALNINARGVARFMAIPRKDLVNMVNMINNQQLSVFELINALKWHRRLARKYITSDVCAGAEAKYVKNFYHRILKHAIKTKIKNLLRVS